MPREAAAIHLRPSRRRRRTQARSRSSSKSKKKPTKQSSADDAAFRQGYRAAHATIYEHNDYAAAIGQLKALGHDDNAGVANLIGYSYRKLGDYKLSQAWYERALKTDPNHVLTWQYYGLWQIEQGNRDQASYHLSRIAAICGTVLRGISVVGRGARKAARHPIRLLSVAMEQSGCACGALALIEAHSVF